MVYLAFAHQFTANRTGQQGESTEAGENLLLELNILGGGGKNAGGAGRGNENCGSGLFFFSVRRVRYRPVGGSKFLSLLDLYHFYSTPTHNFKISIEGI